MFSKLNSYFFSFIYKNIPIIIIIPPIKVLTDGISLKINIAIVLANTGSHNVAEDINVAVTYWVIQLYIVWPKIEQKSARAKNRTNSLMRYG